MPSTPAPLPVPTDDRAPARGVTRRRFLAGTAAGAAAAGVAATLPAAAPAKAARRANVSRAKVAAMPTTSATLPDATAILADGRDLVDHDIMELAALMRSGATTSVDITKAYIARIKTFNGPFETYSSTGGYNAFVRIDEESALAEAAAADALIAAERAGGAAASWLCGIPMGFKDSIGVKGFAAQNGTASYYGNVANEDSGPVARLRAHGVVCLGITICSSYSSSIIGGVAGNAWDFTRVTGGSSQGSGVAAVARLVAACLGEETGGSIMMPSSANGASAIKPSAGVVPTNGVMPLTPTVDVIGPMAKSGRDAALILNAISGVDQRDPQTWQVPRPFPEMPVEPRPGAQPLAGITIGIPTTDWTTASTSTVPQNTYQAGYLAVFERVRTELIALGATVKTFPWVNMTQVNQDPFFLSTTSVGSTTAGATSARNTIAYAARAELRYIEAVAAFAATRGSKQAAALESNYGNFVTTAAQYRSVTAGMRTEAEARRRQLVHNCNKSLADNGVDFMMVMATPSAPTTSIIPVYRSYYQLPNQIGWPMVNFPAGFDSATGMPACIAFWGPRFSEQELVQAMIDYQAHYPQWHTARPPDPWTPSGSASTSGRNTSQESTSGLTEMPERRISPEDEAAIEKNNADPMANTDIVITGPELSKARD